MFEGLMETLATRVESEGDYTGAVERWMRLAGHDPFNSRTVLRLMEAQAAAGDPANAVLYGREHTELLRRELGVEPPEVVVDLVERLSTPQLTAELDAGDYQLGVPRIPRLPVPLGETVAATSTDLEPLRLPVPWIRRRRVTSIAAAAAAMALAIGYSWSLRGGRPDLIPNRVAVMPFENRTGRTGLDAVGFMMADLTTDGLTGIDGLEVVPASVTIRFSREAGPGSSQIEVGGRVRTLADETGAGTIVRGAYYVLGDSLRLQAEIGDEIRRRVLESVLAIGPAGDPMIAAEDLIRRIMTVLAGELRRGWNDGSQRVPTGHIPLYEAYVLDRRAVEKAGRPESDRDLRGAIQDWRRAFEIDSAYLHPLLMAGWAHWILEEYSQADSLLQFLEARRDRLTPGQVLDVELCRTRLDADLQGELNVARRGVALRGAGGQSSLVLAWQALIVNRPREALAALSGVDPSSWRVLSPANYWDQLTAAHHMLGQHEQELSEARRGRVQFPHALETLGHEVRALAALGRREEVDDRLDDAINLGFGSPSGRLAEVNNRLHEVINVGSGSPGALMRNIAAELRAHGNPEAARQVLARALAWTESRPADEASTPGFRRNLGWILMGLERWSEAQEIFRDLIQEVPDNLVHLGTLGILVARGGDIEEARRIEQELQEMDTPYSKGSNTYQRAVIAAHLGELDRAVQLLRQAHSQGVWFEPWFHSNQAFEPLRGHPGFEEFMRPKG
jgi:tetratricopeptide (TPR) repeat protein